MVLPLSIARWSLFNHKKVTTAGTIFAVSMYNLSGAINVLLFLIVRPQLLLFSSPEEFSEPEVLELVHPTTGSAIVPCTVIYSHSPQQSGTRFVDDAEDKAWNLNPTPDSNSIALSRIDSRRRSDDI